MHPPSLLSSPIYSVWQSRIGLVFGMITDTHVLAFYKIRSGIREDAFHLFTVLGAVSDVYINVSICLCPIVHNARYNSIGLNSCLFNLSFYFSAKQCARSDSCQQNSPDNNSFIHTYTPALLHLHTV